MRPYLIMPAAGEGQRFRDAGFSVPKPFIQLDERRVFLDGALQPFNFVDPDQRLVVLRDEHEALWATTATAYQPLFLKQPQEGAALSVLACLNRMEDDAPVIVANSDQVYEKSLSIWYEDCRLSGCDGSILTFDRENDPKWSYARVAPHDPSLVTEVAEKVPISRYATCGVYYFRRWRQLRTAICQMIAAGERYNGEFYLAPVYNQLIRAGLTVRRFDAKPFGFYSIGTPELFKAYVERLQGNRAA